jgi:hypothetical protein
VTADRHILVKEGRIDGLEAFSAAVDLCAREVALTPKIFSRRERQKRKEHGTAGVYSKSQNTFQSCEGSAGSLRGAYKNPLIPPSLPSLREF